MESIKLLRAILPEVLIDNFDVVKFDKTSTRFDIYLDEKKVMMREDKRNSHVISHCLSHNKIFYWLNVNDLSTLKNVTANDLETSYIFFFHNFAIYKERLGFGYKGNFKFWKTYRFA